MVRGRLRRRHGGEGDDGDELLEIDPSELSGVFTAPPWLRDAGFSSWLLVGVALFLVAVVWLLTLTQVIFIPLVTAGVVAAVAAPLVSLMRRHGIPRGIGAALVLLGIFAVGALSAYLILAGIASETSGIASHLKAAVSDIEGWLADLGVSDGKASKAGADLSSGASDGFSALLHGVAGGIKALSSVAFFLAMTILSLFFLLKDGPAIREWGEGRMGVPREVARTITARTLQALRGYFLGVTIVAAFSSVLVGVGALILGVPLAATIAIVTFLAGYVPYLGAWSAGAFSVLVALGGAGPEAAAGMVAIQLLSNGPLQQLVQPVAYGAALGIHPLAVLVATIAGGALFGAVGLILAAPLVSAVTRISVDLRDASVRPDASAPPEASPATG